MTTTPQTCDLLCTAQCLLTQDADRTVITNGAIAVKDGSIIALGNTTDILARLQATRTINLGEALIMPGLINAHTHSPMSLLRGYADDLPLMTWLTEHIFSLEQRLTPQFVELGALLSCIEMLRFGVTSFCDMYLMEDGVFNAVDKAGLRVLGGEVIFAFPSPAYADTNAAFKLIRKQAERWKGHNRIRVAVMPHAVYTTNPELLISCRDLAEELNIPLHIHLAESRAESDGCMQAHSKRPIPYCHDLGLLTPHTLLAHCVDLNDTELDILAKSGSSVAHCPRSNMKLASGVARVPAMLERSINVALGTDGAASSNNMNMLSEINTAALLHKAISLDPTCLPAQQALDMATRNAAAAIFQPELGQLVVGAPADFIALRMDEPHMQPLHCALSHVVYAASGLENCLTVVDGNVLYHNGEYPHLDYNGIKEHVQRSIKKLCQK